MEHSIDIKSGVAHRDRVGDDRPRHAASGDSTAALNRGNNSASRRSASSMLRAFTWPKPRIRSGNDAISTARAWLVWSRSPMSDATTCSYRSMRRRSPRRSCVYPNGSSTVPRSPFNRASIPNARIIHGP